MARPTKWRKIEHTPAVPYFVPSETEAEGIEHTVLLIEELEALRLKDLEGLEQSECAKRMEVSRPTFQRILLSAREKVTDSLINGKNIHIAGGNYTRNICSVECQGCHATWKESFENLQKIKNGEYACPTCGSSHINCLRTCQGRFCHKNCWRNRQQNTTES